MLTIRFQRVGKRHQPSYRLVVVERRSKLGGPPIEYVGHYNPATKEGATDKERLMHWLGVGAKPTVTVHNFLVRHGIIKGPKTPVSMKRIKEESGSAEQASLKEKTEGPSFVSADHADAVAPHANLEDGGVAQGAAPEPAGEAS